MTRGCEALAPRSDAPAHRPDVCLSHAPPHGGKHPSNGAGEGEGRAQHQALVPGELCQCFPQASVSGEACRPLNQGGQPSWPLAFPGTSQCCASPVSPSAAVCGGDRHYLPVPWSHVGGGRRKGTRPTGLDDRSTGYSSLSANRTAPRRARLC